MLRFPKRFRSPNAGAGRLSTYASYAFGEIVLVVIGILIALQINAWYQRRLDRMEVRELLTDYVRDLEVDIGRIDRALEGNDYLLKGQDSLLGIIDLNRQGLPGHEREMLVYSIKYTYWYEIMEFSELAISRLKYGDGLKLLRDQDVLNQMLEYDQGIARCKTMYAETQNYFHAMEAGQKAVLNLSLCKDFVFAVEADLDNMFLPTARVDQMIREGAYLLNHEPEQIGQYYNDVLFYRTSLRNAMTSLRQQREQAGKTVETIRKNYGL